MGQAASDRVRLGMIGIGSRGGLLMDNLMQTPGVEIAGVCDDYAPNLERAHAATKRKAYATADYRALLDRQDIDGVVIATPLYMHAPMCLATLAAGKHVFCEKSLALTIADCKRVASAAARSAHVFQIGHQRLFDARFHKALGHMRRGDLGPITQIRAYWHRNIDWRRKPPTPALERKLNWRLYRAYSGGLMTELGSHHLHVSNWIFDHPPLSCIGYGSTNYWRDGREVFDNVNAIYRYPGDVQTIYDSLSSNRHHGMEVEVMGPKGTMELESGRMFWESPPQAVTPPDVANLVRQLEQGTAGPMPLAAPTWTPETKSNKAGVPILANWKGDDGTGLSLAAFANSVRSGEKMPGMVDHAYRSGVAALMGLQAMLERREVMWPGNYKI
ncbi:Gfo/Idh/MocA family protein [Sphingomonas sp. Leaf25]|uniref:Gfo/Idh/MocA family protein n=1 Tax=Sphingomonas sp. Leaf25 TaxID=1735692 RepID=UPI00138F63D1|nr:Gfo/Idh/MocA family oxidoreductase [Sphingomonas sp. Leaf25]